MSEEELVPQGESEGIASGIKNTMTTETQKNEELARGHDAHLLS